MSAYFSTEASIIAKNKEARVKLWGDRNRDGVLDPTTVSQALVFAKSRILAFIQTRYGSQILEWDSNSVPDVLRDISDTLALWYIATGQNAINETIEKLHVNAIKELKMLRLYEMDIPEVSDSDSYMTVTDDMESTFEEEHYTYEGSDGDWTTAPAFFPR